MLLGQWRGIDAYIDKVDIWLGDTDALLTDRLTDFER